MAIGVFGDTQSFEFSPLTKTVGSVAECPMRFFETNIPSAQTPYAPTDPRWKEIADQSIIDKIKYQDGIYNSLAVNSALAETPIGDAVNNYIVKHNASVDGNMSVELEGNTLVSLVNNGVNYSNWSVTSGTKNSNGIQLTQNLGNDIALIYPTIKSSTVYTLIINVTQNTLSNKNNFVVSLIGSSTVDVVIGDVGLKAIKFTTKSDISGLNGRLALLIISAEAEGVQVTFKDMVLLEGDYTNKPIPSYFEGIKNIDTVEVKSIGKNLFNNTMKDFNTYSLIGAYVWKTIKLKSNTQYSIKLNATETMIGKKYYYLINSVTTSTIGIGGWLVHDSSGVGATGLNTVTFTTDSSGVMYLGFYADNGITITKFNDMFSYLSPQLEQNSVATTFEAYKESKKSITLTNGINRLPNGVFDTITSDGRVLRNIGKVVLNGSENWVLSPTNTTPNTIAFRLSNSLIKTPTQSDSIIPNNIISDKFNATSYDSMYGVDSEAISTRNTENYVYIRVLKSKLSTIDVAGFKTWLASNNVTVYYELATPTTETTTSPNVSSYKGGTLIIDTVIPPYVREIHSNDSSGLSYTSSTSKMSKHMMVEVDLSGICTSLYGGSNASLKSGMKQVTVDGWINGSGSNGVLTNGAKVSSYNYYFNGWKNSGWDNSAIYPNNITSSITKVTLGQTPFSDGKYYSDRLVGTSNKIYILLSSMYSSDATIPSILNVDYLNTRVDFNRTVDTPSPTSIVVPKNWSMLIKGLMPTWTTFDSSTMKSAFSIEKNSNNSFRLKLNCDGAIVFQKKYNGIWYQLPTSTSGYVLNKFQQINILVQQTTTNMEMYILRNGSVMDKFVLSEPNCIEGAFQFYVGCYTGTVYQMDSFVDKYIFFNRTFSDNAQVEQILRGQYQGFGYEELVQNGTFYNDTLTNWTVVGSPTVIKNKATIHVGDKLTQTINVFPNNKYRFKADKDNVDGSIIIDSYYGNTLLRSDTLTSATNIDGTIIIPSNANKVKLSVVNNGTQSVKISNISMKFEM